MFFIYPPYFLQKKGSVLLCCVERLVQLSLNMEHRTFKIKKRDCSILFEKTALSLALGLIKIIV